MTTASTLNNAFRVQLAHPDARIPQRMSNGAAGYDLYACEAAIIPARGIARVSTGVCVGIPVGTYARVAPRSGLACKGIDVGAGVVDADFREAVCVILYNHSDADFSVNIGDRIAQLILEVIKTPPVLVVPALDITDRGGGGFGSTGV